VLMEVYPGIPPSDTYGFRKCVEAIKVGVPLARYIEDRALTKLKPSDLRLVGLCPLHEEKTPSFTVFENQSFFCFGCHEWGDIVSLHARIDGHEAQWTAMIDLSIKYDVPLPERPQRWHDWQKTKTDIRNAAAEARRVVRRERFFKLLVLSGPEFDIEDDEERRAAIERAWRVWEAETRRIWL
jgi:hypothetical protein